MARFFEKPVWKRPLSPGRSMEKEGSSETEGFCSNEGGKREKKKVVGNGKLGRSGGGKWWGHGPSENLVGSWAGKVVMFEGQEKKGRKKRGAQW